MKNITLILCIICLCSCSSKHVVINDFITSQAKAEDSLYIISDKIQLRKMIELLEYSYPEAKAKLTRNTGDKFEYTISLDQFSKYKGQIKSLKWNRNDFPELNVIIWENSALWSEATIVKLVDVGEKDVFKLSEPIMLDKELAIFYLIIDKYPTAETKERCLIVMKKINRKWVMIDKIVDNYVFE